MVCCSRVYNPRIWIQMRLRTWTRTTTHMMKTNKYTCEICGGSRELSLAFINNLHILKDVHQLLVLICSYGGGCTGTLRGIVSFSLMIRVCGGSNSDIFIAKFEVMWITMKFIAHFYYMPTLFAIPAERFPRVWSFLCIRFLFDTNSE